MDEYLKEKAQKEYIEVLDWAVNETNKVMSELRKSGELPKGLGPDPDELSYISKERDRKTDEILKKYTVNN